MPNPKQLHAHTVRMYSKCRQRLEMMRTVTKKVNRLNERRMVMAMEDELK